MMFRNYHKAVKYLELLDKQTKHSGRSFFYVARMAELSARLNINFESFKFIHVAGTSGKGSTVTMVHDILREAGKRVGSFYSPHPTTTIERIRVGDKYIAPADFVKFLNKLKPVIRQMARESNFGQPSYFQALLAMALKYFQEKKCEYVILETGCGGKFCATNFIPRPIITAITNVGLDHTKLLGKSLTAIARQKGGIIKTGSLFVTSEQRKQLIKIFRKICRRQKAKFIKLNKPKPHRLSMIGAHQQQNANLAAKIGELLGINCRAILRALNKITLPCRLETIARQPLIVLDGAHNYDKLKATMQNLKNFEFNNLFIVFTLNKNKDIKRIIKMMAKQLTKIEKQHAGGVTKIFLTKHQVTARPCANLIMMYNLFPSAYKKKISTYNNPWRALKDAIKEASKEDLVLITGSFYLTGELRKKWVSEEKILKHLASGI